MNVLRFDRFGEPAEVVRLESEPSRTLGEGEVRVKLTSRAIHPSDLATIRGRYGLEPAPLPSVPGFDAAGEVVEVGANVAGTQSAKLGDRVILLLGATRGEGTWREEVCVPANLVVATPANLPDANAGSVWVNYLSAWALANHVLALPRGATLLQTAAGSQFGRAMMELARLRGFRLVNVVRRPEQVAELEALDNGPVLCSEDPDFVPRARELAGADGLHYAIDSVAGLTGAKVLECLAPGGNMIVFGALDQKPLPMDPSVLLFKQLTVRGFWLRPWANAAGPAILRELALDVLTHITRGNIMPAIDSVFPFADYREALLRSETPGRKGAVVLA